MHSIGVPSEADTLRQLQGSETEALCGCISMNPMETVQYLLVRVHQMVLECCSLILTTYPIQTQTVPIPNQRSRVVTSNSTKTLQLSNYIHVYDHD